MKTIFSLAVAGLALAGCGSGEPAPSTKSAPLPPIENDPRALPAAPAAP